MLEQKWRVTRQMYTTAISRWGEEPHNYQKRFFSKTKTEEERGGVGPYPILLCRKTNWPIPKYRFENRRNTDIAFRSLYIGHAYLKLHPSSLLIYLKRVCAVCPCILLIWVVRWWPPSEPAPAEEGKKMVGRWAQKKFNNACHVGTVGCVRE